MDEIARLSPRDRSEFFRAAAEQRGVTVGVIEKDFWVCWVLRRVYSITSPRHRIHFKGGTSLSKVFAVIDRMSEDIDLIVDRADLGFVGENDPTSPELSNKARQRLIDDIRATTHCFVHTELRSALERAFSESLGTEATPGRWTMTMAEDDPDDQTILFGYPTIETPSAYLHPMIRLELGARGDPWPTVKGSIQPYAAEVMAGQFDEPKTEIPLVVAAQRTFWEKATILHMLHHMPQDKPVRPRVARHYYDTSRLAQHELGREAIADKELLARVVQHKRRFFSSSWARYDLAKPGTLRLTPPDYLLAPLRSDYEEMSEEMMFGDVPDFDTVIKELQRVETDINR